MTGADIIGALLRADSALLARVPEASIKAGRLPDGITPPALLVRVISSVERQALRRGAATRTVDRVSVTVRAGSYRDQTAIIALVKARCAGRTGNIGGGRNVAILTAGTGPDINGPGDSFEQAQDFRVSFDAQT